MTMAAATLTSRADNDQQKEGARGKWLILNRTEKKKERRLEILEVLELSHHKSYLAIGNTVAIFQTSSKKIKIKLENLSI